MEDGKSHSQEFSPHIPTWKNHFGGVTSFPHPAGYSRCSHMEQLRFPGRQRGAQAPVGVENSSRRTMGTIPGKQSQPDLQELLKSRVSLPALFLEFSWSHSLLNYFAGKWGWKSPGMGMLLPFHPGAQFAVFREFPTAQPCLDPEPGTWNLGRASE